MARTPFISRSLPVLLALALAAGACGDSDDGGDTTENAGATTTSAAEATSGSGEVTIAGTAYSFSSESCIVGSGNEAVVEVSGTGNTGGRNYEVEIVRSQPASNFVERVTLAYSGTEGSVATMINPPADAVFEIDGQSVRASGLQFTGGGGAPSGEGSFTLTCDGS